MARSSTTKHTSQTITLIPDDPNDPRYNDPPERKYATAIEPDGSSPFEEWTVRASSASKAYNLIHKLWKDDQVHLVGWEIVVSKDGNVTVAGEITGVEKKGLKFNLTVLETLTPVYPTGFGTLQGPPSPGQFPGYTANPNVPQPQPTPDDDTDCDIDLDGDDSRSPFFP